MGLGMHRGLLSWDPNPHTNLHVQRHTLPQQPPYRPFCLKTPEPLDQHQVRELSQFKTNRGRVEDGSMLISNWCYISPRNHSPGNRVPILHPSHPPIPLLEHLRQHQDNRELIDNANHQALLQTCLIRKAPFSQAFGDLTHTHTP